MLYNAVMKAVILREATRIAFEKHNSHPMRSRGYCLFTFIVEKNKILGFGVNNKDRAVEAHYGYQKRARGWNNEFKIAEHSEISCWRRTRGLIVGQFDMINIRITDGKHLALSAPCAICCDWLSSNGCGNVYFSTYSNFAKIAL